MCLSITTVNLFFVLQSSSKMYSKDHDAEVHTEELGRSGPSLPSRTHSEFAGGAAAGRRKVNET